MADDIPPPVDLDDDDIIAPPDDGFGELMAPPPGAPPAGSGNASAYRVPSSAGSATSSRSRRRGSSAAGQLAQQKAQAATASAAPPPAMWRDTFSPGRDNGASTAASAGSDVIRVSMSRTAHAVHQALRYRGVMRTGDHPLSQVEEESVTAQLQSYFVANGFTKTAQAMCDLGSLRPELHDEIRKNPALELPAAITAAADRTADLFDDETAWPSEGFFSEDFNLRPIGGSKSKTTAGGDKGRPGSAKEKDKRAPQLFGTLNMLIERLVLSETDDPLPPGQVVHNYTNAFLATLTVFTTPDVFVSRMVKLFKTATMHGKLTGEERQAEIHRRIIRLLARWVAAASVDTARLLLERLLSFAMSCSTAPHLQPSVKAAAAELADTVTALDVSDGVADERWTRFPAHEPPPVQRPRTARMVAASPAPIVASGAAGTDNGAFSGVFGAQTAGSFFAQALRPPPEFVDFDSVSVSDLSKQLCLMSFEYFCQIRPREVLNCSWEEEVLKPLTSGMTSFVAFHEDITLWMAAVIVSPPTVSGRRARVVKVIQIAQQLFDVQNYAAAAAVFEALEHQAVAQLTDTMDPRHIPAFETDVLAALREAFDPFKGTLKAIPWDLTTPCVPQLRQYIGELCKVHEACKTFMVDYSANPSAIALTGDASGAPRSPEQGPSSPNSIFPPNTHGFDTVPSKLAAYVGGAMSVSTASLGTVAGLTSQAPPTLFVNWTKLHHLGKYVLRFWSYQRRTYAFAESPGVRRLVERMPLRRDEPGLMALSRDRKSQQ